MSTTYEIGSNIRKIRKERGLTIVDLSMITNYCPSHITQVELGTRRMSIDFLLTIADALETDANTILNVKKEVDLAEELGIILKSMSKEDGRKVINILLSIKESIAGGDE